jgi:hypothetical protein
MVAHKKKNLVFIRNTRTNTLTAFPDSAWDKGLPTGNSTVLAGIRAGGSTFIAFPVAFQASSG